jgi:hypothetical protein
MAIDKDSTFLAVLPSGGHQLLLYGRDEGGWVLQEPIIGFALYSSPTHDKEGFVHGIHPITAEQVYDYDSQPFALLKPDGKVTLPEDRDFESVDEFRKWLSTSAAVA